MNRQFGRWHYMAYGCYLIIGLVGLGGALEETGVVSILDGAEMPLGLMLAGVSAVAVLGGLSLSIVLWREWLLVILAGLTLGIPVAMWIAVAISPQNQSVAGWYAYPATLVILITAVIRVVLKLRESRHST